MCLAIVQAAAEVREHCPFGGTCVPAAPEDEVALFQHRHTLTKRATLAEEIFNEKPKCNYDVCKDFITTPEGVVNGRTPMKVRDMLAVVNGEDTNDLLGGWSITRRYGETQGLAFAASRMLTGLMSMSTWIKRAGHTPTYAESGEIGVANGFDPEEIKKLVLHMHSGLDLPEEIKKLGEDGDLVEEQYPVRYYDSYDPSNPLHERMSQMQRDTLKRIQSPPRCAAEGTPMYERQMMAPPNERCLSTTQTRIHCLRKHHSTFFHSAETFCGECYCWIGDD